MTTPTSDPLSIEQICRDLLEFAISDGLVDQHPSAANLLQERIRQLKWNPPRPSPSSGTEPQRRLREALRQIVMIYESGFDPADAAAQMEACARDALAEDES